LGRLDRFGELERDVLRLKFEIGAAFHEHCLAYSAETTARVATRLRLAEAALKNCEAIANYVRVASSPTADRLIVEMVSATASLEEIKSSAGLTGLGLWYKERLAPLLAKSEAAAYLVATMIQLDNGEGSFRWSMSMEDLADAHLARFGKRAADIKFLDEPCPVCDNRRDEFGWCGHGTIGGD
jgi:hypothetical protein